jgi:hypothetical protein
LIRSPDINVHAIILRREFEKLSLWNRIQPLEWNVDARLLEGSEASIIQRKDLSIVHDDTDRGNC